MSVAAGSARSSRSGLVLRGADHFGSYRYRWYAPPCSRAADDSDAPRSSMGTIRWRRDDARHQSIKQHAEQQTSLAVDTLSP